MWSIRPNTAAESSERQGRSARRARRLVDRGRAALGLPRRARDDTQADPAPALHPRRAGHDAVDVLAHEDLVAQQRHRELLELAAVLADQPLRGPVRLVGEVLLLVVAQLA